MGYQNVVAVFASYTDLPHRAFRALVRMALVARDEPNGDAPAREYFEGHDALAVSLGLTCPPRPRPGDKSHAAEEARLQRRSAHEVVRRVVAELRAAGAVEVKAWGQPGRRAVYVLNLDPFAGRRADLQANETLARKPTKRWPEANETLDPSQRDVGAKENEENLKKKGEEKRSRRPSHSPARAHQDAQDDYAIALTYITQADPDHTVELVAQADAEGVKGYRAQVIRAAELLRAEREGVA